LTQAAPSKEGEETDVQRHVKPIAEEMQPAAGVSPDAKAPPSSDPSYNTP